MLLALDVGNTNIVLAAFEGAQIRADWRVRTDRDRTTDEHGLLITHLLQHRGLDPAGVTGFVISNVVPTMSGSLADVARIYFGCEPLSIGPDTDVGIRVLYNPPSDVGADRLANAVAVYARYGGPAIVVDLGTATTFDAIDVNGDYLGGAIAPGIRISSEALFRLASRLYRVQLAAPGRAVGTNTVEAMQSGIVFGFAGQVDALVHRIRAEIGADARVVATGGLAELIASQSQTIQAVDPLLTLEGLRLLWERNRHRLPPPRAQAGASGPEAAAAR